MDVGHGRCPDKKILKKSCDSFPLQVFDSFHVGSRENSECSTTFTWVKIFWVFLDATFSCKRTHKKTKGTTRKNRKPSKNPARKHKKHARRQQEQHHNTKTTQNVFGICGRIMNHKNCKWMFQKTRKTAVISSTNNR